MLSIYITAVVLQSRSLLIPQSRAVYYAAGIVEAVEALQLDSPDEEYELVAALLVNGERESRWRFDVETCRTLGIGGLGTFGVGPLAGGHPCGPIAGQAKLSMSVWQSARTDSWRDWFGRYIGARARGRHPEAVLRTRIFSGVLRSLKCACSDFA